jgi:hypothetical protein
MLPKFPKFPNLPSLRRTADDAMSANKARGVRLALRVAAPLATSVLVVGFFAAFAAARGAHPPSQPGSALDGTAEPTAAPTASDPATPTVAAGAQPVYVRVTANQDYRFSCLDRAFNYEVTLRNVSDVAVGWQIAFPYTPQADRYPYWAGVGPKDDASPTASGTIAAEQSANLLVWPQAGYPCAGVTYHTTIHLRLPAGRSQPDLHLTYAGSGPEPFVHLAVIHNQNYSERCVDGVAPPPTYMVTLQNTGNTRANIQPLPVEEGPLAGQWWAVVGTTSATWWIEANSTMDLVITPKSWIGCGANTYHVKVGANSDVGMLPALMLTDTVS